MDLVPGAVLARRGRSAYTPGVYPRITVVRVCVRGGMSQKWVIRLLTTLGASFRTLPGGFAPALSFMGALQPSRGQNWPLKGHNLPNFESKTTEISTIAVEIPVEIDQDLIGEPLKGVATNRKRFKPLAPALWGRICPFMGQI